MVKKLLSIVVVILILCGQAVSQYDSRAILNSPYNARTIYELAAELYKCRNATPAQREQALVMLNAAYMLDRTAKYVLPDIVELATASREKDYTDAVVVTLKNYVDSDTDLVIPTQGIKYLLERQNTLEERQATLSLVLRAVAARNDFLQSDVATELGVLQAEKADFDGARSLFLQGYSKNPYNRLSFSKIAELSEEPLGEIYFLQHFRLMMGLNPLDLDSAVRFSEQAHRFGVYDIAYDGWQYCADLFAYLYPDEVLPYSIYVPWASCAMYSPGNAAKCLQIAAKIRETGEFDVVMETIAAGAATKLADTELADKILADAEVKAVDGKTSASDVSWFYCFAKPNAEQALAWANKAYSDEPNSPSVLAIFGYAMTMNDQFDIAGEYLKGLEDNQITLLAKAKISKENAEDANAIELLKTAVSINPASIEGKSAKQLLDEMGSAYIPETDPITIADAMKRNFGSRVVGEFVRPEDMISFRIKLEGNEFSYGRDLKANLVITNNSSQDIIISPDGLFNGNILVEAKIRGDINAAIPELMRKRIRPAKAIRPGRSVFVPIDIISGPLGEIITSYPQAKFEIELKAYLDPVVDADGNIRNAIASQPPAETTIKRSPVQLNSRYLQRRLGAVSSGQQGQKIRSAKLFAGLLTEQAAMANFKKPLYKMFYIESALLESAIIKALRDDNWTVKMQAMAAMRYLPIDTKLAGVLGELIQDEKWPVRLLAIRLLSRSEGGKFKKVLNWVARNDSNGIVKEMAVALGAETATVETPETD